MSWLSRLVNVFRSDRVGDALDDELAFHLEATIDALIAEGLAGRGRDAEARRRLGNARRDARAQPRREAAALARGRRARRGFRSPHAAQERDAPPSPWSSLWAWRWAPARRPSCSSTRWCFESCRFASPVGSFILRCRPPAPRRRAKARRSATRCSSVSRRPAPDGSSWWSLATRHGVERCFTTRPTAKIGCTAARLR